MKILSFSCLLIATTATTLLAQGTTAQADRRFLQDLEQSDPRAPAPVPAGDAPVTPAADLPTGQTRNAPPPTEPTVVTKPAPAVRRGTVAQDRVNEASPSRRNDNSATQSVSREKVQMEQRQVTRRQKKESDVRTVETGEVNDTTSEGGVRVLPPVRRSNRTSAERTVDVETMPSGRVEITPRAPAPPPVTTTRRTYSAPAQTEEVATRPAKTVTVTKTTNAVPEEDADHSERHDEHGFLYRLFHHERPRKEAPVTTTTVEESTRQPVVIENR